MAESNLHDFSSTGLPFSKNCNDLIIIIYALKFRVQCSSEKAKNYCIFTALMMLSLLYHRKFWKVSVVLLLHKGNFKIVLSALSIQRVLLNALNLDKFYVKKGQYSHGQPIYR